MNILLIEDNTDLANQLVNFMQGLGWQVDYAAEGKLGLQLATQQAFDVVLLDLNLPDQDGLQVCKTLLQTVDKRPPVLMLTARDSFNDKASGFNAGADDYLAKPFDPRELALRIRTILRRAAPAPAGAAVV